MIRLFTTSYPERNPARWAEYDECLRRNLECAAIDQVCLLVEGDGQLPVSPKLVTRCVAERPKYADYLTWIREIVAPGDVSVISNSDIFFDQGLSLLRTWDIPAHTALALSRWDSVPHGPRLYDHNDSQDSWIFKGTPGNIVADFPVGVPRCDNRFAHELEAAGYRVTNPSFSLRSYHLHTGARSGYENANQPGFVPPPYKYVWPHNLWSLPKTLRHNLLNPSARVGWRLDRRQWSSRLKLHWIERAWRLIFPAPGRAKARP